MLWVDLRPEPEARAGADALGVDKLVDVAGEVGVLLLQFSELVAEGHGQVEAVGSGG